MISILLIILKIIGITVLVILGLLFVLLLLVLFVPVRYRFKGNYDESFQCKGKITWLLHFISIKIVVEKEVVTSVKIMGIPLSLFVKKKKENAVQTDVEEDKGHRTEEVIQVEETGQTEKAGQTEKEKFSIEEKQTGSSVNTSSNEAEAQESVDNTTMDSDAEKKSIIQKIKDVFQTIKQKIDGIIQKIRDIVEKIKDFIKNSNQKKQQIKRYLKIIQSDTTKAAFALCKKKIFKMLKHIFPRKLRAELTFGFDDPATTGYTLAVYGMLPAYFGKNIILHPDFDKQVFHGKCKVIGAIRAWTLLYQVLSVLMDKNCRKLYRIVKKEISNEHK